jgi:hypothetical protein
LKNGNLLIIDFEPLQYKNVTTTQKPSTMGPEPA